jgi:serine/threonine-protein kinase HipA
MRQARVFIQREAVAEFIEHSRHEYELRYLEPSADGPEISLTLPRSRSPFRFGEFPAFFEGLLPEGAQLAALLRQYKLDERDYFSQLMIVGGELVGAVTIVEMRDSP